MDEGDEVEATEPRPGFDTNGSGRCPACRHAWDDHTVVQLAPTGDATGDHAPVLAGRCIRHYEGEPCLCQQPRPVV